VGGDFYNFIRLPEHRLGVMLGDVSSHGFAAALVMALVLSASAIHAEEADSPGDVLRLLLDSVGGDPGAARAAAEAVARRATIKGPLNEKRVSARTGGLLSSCDLRHR